MLRVKIGFGLSLLGYQVILVDCDLGGADLHLFFDQLAPALRRSHFFHERNRDLGGSLIADLQ